MGASKAKRIEVHPSSKGKVVSPKRSRLYQYDNDETNMPFILLYQFSWSQKTGGATGKWGNVFPELSN